MKIIASKISFIFREYTSGVPLFFWALGGFSVLVFIFVFRNEPYIHFNELKYVLSAMLLWIIPSDILKKRKVLQRNVHFILDSIFYVLSFSIIVYLTDGHSGDIFFLFFLATISAPLFGTFKETLFFIIALSAATYVVYFLTAVQNGTLTSHHTGIITLQVVFYFVIAGVNKFFLIQLKKADKEKRILAQKTIEEIRHQVEARTKELNESVSQLKNSELVLSNRNNRLSMTNKKLTEVEKALREKIEEEGRFNRMVVGRELKMIELKRELEELKGKLEK